MWIVLHTQCIIGYVQMANTYHAWIIYCPIKASQNIRLLVLLLLLNNSLSLLFCIE